jgi:FkbM family methyltransferase
MLIDFSLIYKFLEGSGKTPRGVFHIGAHECEEKEAYNTMGISDTNIVWVDGNEDIVKRMKSRGITNIHYALVDETEHDVVFYITNNGQSSSILEMGTHKDLYKHIVVVEERKQRTTTLEKLVQENKLDMTNLNFWNFDIQGAELLALKGAGDLLHYADALYLEVNTQEVYKNCARLEQLDEFLFHKGFQRVAISMYKNNIGGDDGWGDALWIRV